MFHGVLILQSVLAISPRFTSRMAIYSVENTVMAAKK